MRTLSRFRVPIVLALLLVLVAGIVIIGRGNLKAQAAGTSNIKLFLNYGNPGYVTTVTGSSFGANESVTITLDTLTVATATTDAKGAFSQKFSIPANALHGHHPVIATGQTSGLTAQATFLVQSWWVMYGYNVQHTHYNPYENRLTNTTVAGLGLKWSY